MSGFMLRSGSRESESTIVHRVRLSDPKKRTLEGFRMSEEAELAFHPLFLAGIEQAVFLEHLHSSGFPWHQPTIRGKKTKRAHAFFSDGSDYTYSGVTWEPAPWTDPLAELRDALRHDLKIPFNSALLTLYHSGGEGLGWHADDESIYGRNPVIASISLGATRVFQLRHKENPDAQFDIRLTSGSLLVMRGSTQHYWEHRVPVRKGVKESRINLTFRWDRRSSRSAGADSKEST